MLRRKGKEKNEERYSNYLNSLLTYNNFLYTEIKYWSPEGAQARTGRQAIKKKK